MSEQDIIGHSQEVRKRHKPCPTVEQVISQCRRHWGLNALENSVKILDSYDDANFYLAAYDEKEGRKREYLVKYYNKMEADDPDILFGLSHMLEALNRQLRDVCQFPHIISPLHDSGNEDMVFLSDCPLADGSEASVFMRVFDWISGVTMNSIQTNASLLTEVGEVIGYMQKSLVNTDHPSFHRAHLWDLQQFPSSMLLLPFVDDDQIKDIISYVKESYDREVLPVASMLSMSVIMGDCNDANVIITPEGPNFKVVGLIDFSDAVYTWTINEVAITIAYMLLTSYAQRSPWHAVAAVLRGYLKQADISSVEITCLPILIASRLCLSIMVGAYSISKEPDSEYLKIHALPARRALTAWCAQPWKEQQAFFSSCCAAINQWTEDVGPFDEAVDAICSAVFQK
eukprot:gene10598-11743_t